MGDGAHSAYCAAVAVIMVTALCLRVVDVTVAASVSPDAAEWYLPMAEAVANGSVSDGMRASVPPLYPVLGGLLARVVGDVEWSCRLVSLAAGVGTVVFVMLLAARLFGRWPALLSGAFAAGHPYLVRFSADVGVDSVAVFFFTAGAYLLVAYLQQPGIWRICLLGVVLAMLSLSRPEGVVYAVLIFLLAIFAPLGGRWLQRRRLIHGLVLVGIGLALLAPRLAWVHARTSSWTVDTRQASWSMRLWNGIRDGQWNFGQFRVWRQVGFVGLLRTLESVIVGLGPLSIVFGLGGLVSARRSGRFRWILLILVVGAVLVPFLGHRISRRYLLSAAALWQVWAGLGLSVTLIRLVRWVNQKRGREHPTTDAELWRAVLAASVLLIAVHLPWSVVRLHEKRLPARRAGEWILTNYGPNRRIMAVSPIAPWYAQGRHVPVKAIRGGSARHRRFLRRVQRTDTELLVIDKYVDQVLPDFQQWLDRGDLACWPMVYSQQTRDEKGKTKAVIRVFDTRRR